MNFTIINVAKLDAFALLSIVMGSQNYKMFWKAGGVVKATMLI